MVRASPSIGTTHANLRRDEPSRAPVPRYESAQFYWLLHDCGVPAKHLCYLRTAHGEFVTDWRTKRKVCRLADERESDVMVVNALLPCLELQQLLKPWMTKLTCSSRALQGRQEGLAESSRDLLQLLTTKASELPVMPADA